MNKRWIYLLGILTLALSVIWLAQISFPDKNLHLIACNVGEGDAILASYGTTQILIDGGPGNSVIDCLSRHMPFWDRDIEMVILTHQQTDHFRGLIEVFKRFNVENFLATPVDSSSQEYGVLKSLVGSSGSKVLNPTTGMEIGFDLIYLDILYPQQQFLVEKGLSSEALAKGDVLGVFSSKVDPNEFSIVAILRYGNFKALLTSDIEPDGEDEILKDNLLKQVNYIKVPHHGSKNGLTRDFLNIASPEIAVISVGKNQWGHPHQEILDMLKEKGVRILRTDEMGDIEVISDGKSWELRN